MNISHYSAKALILKKYAAQKRSKEIPGTEGIYTIFYSYLVIWYSSSLFRVIS